MENVDFIECEICGAEIIDCCEIIWGNLIISSEACDECFSNFNE